MKISAFDYELPEELIAHEMSEERDHCKLMVIDRHTGEIDHKQFLDLKKILKSGDVLVLNKTKVIPARLLGNKKTGGKVELFLVRRLGLDTWEAISKPGLKEGAEVEVGYSLNAKVTKVMEEGVMEIQFDKSGEELMLSFESVGKTPLPPYIQSDKEEMELRDLYQTVYAEDEGSVAAPTAGFHFTEELIEDLEMMGVDIEYVILHVSLGTFRGVKSEEIEEHHMHPEWFSLDSATADRLNQAKTQGRRIIAVGTTSTRVLETCSDNRGILSSAEGETAIYIYPPYRFKFIDGLITNFHLPKSTLLMLVSAFVSEPNTGHKFIDFESSIMGKAYKEAIEYKYKFFSFGDASLII